MATSYSTLLGLALPVQGELSGTWGDTVNNFITTYLDAAVAGAQTLSTNANVTLTKTTNTALNGTSSQYAIINCTGARTVLRTITAPAASKIYVILNQTTGGFGVKLVGAGPTTGITVAAGTRVLAVWNGTDFVVVAGAAIDLASQVTGTLPIANGGTGRSTGTTAYALVATGTTATGAQQTLASGATTAVLVGGGASALPVWTTATGTGSPVRATSPTLVTPVLGAASATSMNGGQLAGLRNRIINGNFGINQRAYVSGAAVGAGLYGHDRWKMAASADTYTFSTTANVTTITIPATKVLRQVIEGLNLETGTYTLSWSGTAQGKIGAGSLGASGITGAITGGTNTTIEFGPGTVSKVQLEFGSVATPFEQRPYGMELALCQRYYYQSWGSGAFSNIGNSFVGMPVPVAPVSCVGSTSFPVAMRALPTVTLYDDVGLVGNTSQPGLSNSLAGTVTTIGLNGFSGVTKISTSFTAGSPVRGAYVAAIEL